MSRLRKFLSRLRLSSLEPEEYEGGGRRAFDSVDALAAASSRGEKADAQGRRVSRERSPELHQDL